MRKFYQPASLPQKAHFFSLKTIGCSDRLEVCFFTKACSHFSERTLRLLQSHPRHPEMASPMTRRDTSRLSALSSSGDGMSDGTQRPIWSSAPFVEYLNVFQPRLLQSHPRHPETTSPMTYGDTSRLSAPSSSGDGKYDDMQRPIWSSAPFVGDLSVFGQRLFQSHPCHPETTSPMTRRRNMFICFLCWRPQCLSTETTLVSPSSSEDGKSDDTQRHLTAICTLCHPETVELEDPQRFSFAIQRPTSLIACRDRHNYLFFYHLKHQGFLLCS